MASAAVKIPQPLSGTEIKNGLAVRMVNTVPGLSDEVRKELQLAIRKSLNNTCSLNESSHSKFKADWAVVHDKGHDFFRWWVNYNLDDFGRPIVGGIGGQTGHIIPVLGDEYKGSVEEMPPDKFRRETEQPIPAPQVVRKQDKGNEMGIARAAGKGRGRGKGRL